MQAWNQGHGWTITKTHLDGKCVAKPEPDQTIPFRLYDDDNHLYFEGVMAMDLYNSPCVFDPLDATKYAYGCTYMNVKDPNGIWQTI